MSKRVAPLGSDVLADLALAAARAARDHLDAAEYLLTGEFWPEAYAIAATGFEEIGKAWLAVGGMLLPEEQRERVPGDLRRNHRRKLGAAYSMLTIVRYVTPLARHRRIPLKHGPGSTNWPPRLLVPETVGFSPMYVIAPS